MDNLEQILIVMFRRISAQMVIEGYVDANAIKRNTFASATYAYLRQYSESELDNMWSYYKDIFEKEHESSGWSRKTGSNGICVFDALFYYANKMLVIQDNELMCRYERLMPWRMLTFEISEDLLAAAYYAGYLQPTEMEERGYVWNNVLGHNNFQLNAIIDRGISENHFHLYGSSPMFHISWISLMNNVQDETMAKRLKEYDSDRRNGNVRYNDSYKEAPLQMQLYQAAWIRVFLYAILTDTRIEPREITQEICNEQGMDQVHEHSNSFELIGCDGEKESKNDVWKEKLQEYIWRMLRDKYLIYNEVAELQSIIEELRNPYFGTQGREYEDYALEAIGGDGSRINLFSGERWLLHTCLQEIRKENFDQQTENMFYAYVLIKENIRAELIQTNEGVGFRNFQTYEKRKLQLIHSQSYKDEFVRAAVRENMLSPHILSLELRISPGGSAEDNAQYIRQLDSLIGEPKDKYYYVIHFIKQPDEEIKPDDCTQYRHYALRKRIEKEAKAIIDMRERYPGCASRVLGIDAASLEIGCRPEVFACVFRRLRAHTKVLDADESLSLWLSRNKNVNRENGSTSQSIRGEEKYFKLPQLRATYHVGEDFLDLADGLRAIDEAVNFLNLDCGDRLGHAIALGQDVEEWYQSKNYRILLPQQDYLDNITWLYNRLIDFKIPGMDSLKNYIERKFVYYFDQIYGKNIDYEIVDQILDKAKETYKDTKYSNAFYNDRYQFGIYQYYNAWRLRGDDPELYVQGFFDYHDDKTPEEHCRVNYRFPKEFELRGRPEIFLLNYYYQFNPDVRREGSKRIEVMVKPDYVEAVRLVQKEMQRVIGQKGIMVETNPSSNYKIGTFKDYAKHPIFNLYNNGLTYDADELAKCPQLSVSINTDDKGVFSTSLENEYALMAKALEEKRDKTGKQVYSKAMVHNWINAVREMGNEQSFRNPSKG